MAITPDVTTVTVDGVTIGLSDTIDNLIQSGDFTIENLQPYMIVGQNTVGNQYYASLSAAERTYSGSGGSTPDWFPVNNTGSLGDVTVEFQTKDSVTLPHVSYGRNFLVYGTLNVAGEPQQIRADNMDTSDLRVVTSIDFKKIYYDVEMAAATYSYVAPSSGSATYYQTGSQGCVRTTDNDEVTGCFVYSIYGDDSDWYCIKDWMFPADDSANNTWHMSCSQSIQGNFANTYASLGTGYTNFSTTKTMFRWINNQVGAIYGGGSWNWGDAGNLVTVNGDIIQACDYSGGPAYAGGCYNLITGLDNALRQLANAGLKFKWNDTWYKPISEGGIIIGYTDDMTEESDWDDIVDVTGNTVPVTPPGPTPPPPPSADADDMDLTAIGFLSDIGGAGLYWLFPSPPTGMFHDFNLNAPEGSMISQNVLSCYISALNWSWQTVNQKMVIYSNGSKKPAYESTSAYPLIYQNNPHTIAGYYEVPRQTNTFYDFSPYTIYELYIPFCGWIGLPDTVAGRAIRVYMDFDASTCTCKAIVMLESEGGETIIGEITGNFGAPCPIQVVEGGLYKQAAINSGLQVATGAAMAIYGVASGAGALAINGLGNAAQGISSCNSVGNANYGQTIGRSGDTSNLCGGHYCKIRITHPVIDTVVESSIFAHTVGYLCNTVGTLNDFHGFTICLNPHIVGINCTDEEKEEIKRLLEEGVIL